MFTPTSEAAFGKGGILRLCFRKTGWHIAALTLEQMCRLFYLKRASVWRLALHKSSFDVTLHIATAQPVSLHYSLKYFINAALQFIQDEFLYDI